MAAALSFALVSTAVAHPILTCDTTVAVGNGKIVIELREDWAPKGVQRVQELAKSGFFDDLPFFRAIPNFLIQFGISPDKEKQNMWTKNIPDDPAPSPRIPFTDGLVSFAGYGKDSRSTHLFMTLGNQPGLGMSPWEVPVGSVIQGLDVMHGIYMGYGGNVDQGRLNPNNPAAKAYLAQHPKLDSFKRCTITEKKVEL